MKTELVRVNPSAYDPSLLKGPAQVLAEGGLVAFPTETVYGIGANLRNPKAVRRLLEVRKSPAEKLLTVHIGDIDALAQHVKTISPMCHRIVARYWPGPLTIVFPCPDGGTVGIRLPNHPIARDLLRTARVPVVAPSANVSGEPPARTVEEVLRVFEGSIDCVVDGGPATSGIASTVLRVKGNRWEILREGEITSGMIAELDYLGVLFVCTGNTCRSPMAEYLFRKMLADHLGEPEENLPKRGYRISSAGTAAVTGAPSIERTVEAMREFGCDATRHQTRVLTLSHLEQSDFVYVMAENHRRTIAEWAPEILSRTFLLDPEGQDIEDPFLAEPEVYRETARSIRKCLERILPQVLSYKRKIGKIA